MSAEVCSVLLIVCGEEGGFTLNECDRVTQDFMHLRNKVSEKSFRGFYQQSLQLKFKQNCLKSSNSAIQMTVLGEQGGC